MGLDASDGERFRADGLTFVYPTEVYSSASEQPPFDTTGVVVVDLTAPPGAREGKVVATMVRSADGIELDELSGDDRLLLARLEQMAEDVTDADDEPEGGVSFVNGFGVRSVDGEAYRFDGMTDDGRFLVKITGHSDDREALNRVVRSLFVDGAASRFAGETCDEAVELVDENGLSEGATVQPGEEVTAVWDVRNVGTCTWGDGHAWVFTGGEPVAIVATSVSPAEVLPNELARVTVTFLAPDMPGQYAAQWQLQPPRTLGAVAPAAFALFEVAD